MSAISWICPLAVAKTVRWPSQKVTGLPGPLRRHSAPNDAESKIGPQRVANMTKSQVTLHGPPCCQPAPRLDHGSRACQCADFHACRASPPDIDDSYASSSVWG